MTKIELTDTPIDSVVKMSEGNPGAMTAIMKIIEHGERIDPDSFMGGMGAVLLLDTYNIYGTDIWVLYSDICDQSTVDTIAVLRGAQLGFLDGDTLKAACSRQDRSGKKMIDVRAIYDSVKNFLPNFNPQTQNA